MSTETSFLPNGKFDVCLGKKFGISQRPGNIAYRNIIKKARKTYQITSSTQEKNAIAKDVISCIKSLGGKFYVLNKKDKEQTAVATNTSTSYSSRSIKKVAPVVANDEEWVQASFDNVFKKVKQALREKTTKNTNHDLLVGSRLMLSASQQKSNPRTPYFTLPPQNDDLTSHHYYHRKKPIPGVTMKNLSEKIGVKMAASGEIVLDAKVWDIDNLSVEKSSIHHGVGSAAFRPTTPSYSSSVGQGMFALRDKRPPVRRVSDDSCYSNEDDEEKPQFFFPTLNAKTTMRKEEQGENCTLSSSSSSMVMQSSSTLLNGHGQFTAASISASSDTLENQILGKYKMPMLNGSNESNVPSTFGTPSTTFGVSKHVAAENSTHDRRTLSQDPAKMSSLYKDLDFIREVRKHDKDQIENLSNDTSNSEKLQEEGQDDEKDEKNNSLKLKPGDLNLLLNDMPFHESLQQVPPPVPPPDHDATKQQQELARPLPKERIFQSSSPSHYISDCEDDEDQKGELMFSQPPSSSLLTAAAEESKVDSHGRTIETHNIGISHSHRSNCDKNNEEDEVIKSFPLYECFSEEENGDKYSEDWM